MSERGWKPYTDFVIKIERTEIEEAYRVEASAPTGEAKANFAVPFDPKEFKLFLKEVRESHLAASSGSIPEPLQHSVKIGTKLYNKLMAGEVRDIYMTARREAQKAGGGLRIQMRLADAPELTDLPWEFMYDGKDFLVLSNETPLVYYLDMPDPARPVAIELPLRVLVSISAPADQPPLDVEAEKLKIAEGLHALIDSQQVEVDFTPDASLNSIQRSLRQASGVGRPYHVWHYIGHGGFSGDDAGSVLMFTDPSSGKSTPISGFQLGTLFNSYPELRLAILNACEGARASKEDPFNGVASALVKHGVPAVIGMQFEITDRAAITFAGEFYASLVDNLPIDAALAEARRAVFFLPNWVEWATPVLFMRVKDGRLFELKGDAVLGHQIAAAVAKQMPVPDEDTVSHPTMPEPATIMSKRSSTPPASTEDEPDTAVVDYTNKIIYRSVPHVPEPGEKDLLELPWQLVLITVVNDVEKLIPLALYGPAVVGRESTGDESYVSLAAYDAAAQGVSREHALLRPTEEGIFIVDNHSTNGVMINDRPVLPGAPVKLENEAKVRLGKFKLTAYVASQRMAPE